MKKLIALLLAVLMLLTAAAAVAETVTIPYTALKLELGSLLEDAVTDEDEEEGIVMILYNKAETMEAFIYAYDAEDLTLADILEEAKEDETTTLCDYTTINGIECLFWMYTEDGENYLSYFVIDDDVLVEISFWYADEAAAQETRIIMDTLTR